MTASSSHETGGASSTPDTRLADAIEVARGNVLEAKMAYRMTPTYDREVQMADTVWQLDYLLGEEWATREVLEAEGVPVPEVTADGDLHFAPATKPRSEMLTVDDADTTSS